MKLLLTAPLPRKQTRTNVRQSKNGCYTCRARDRARRLKCDEGRPLCQRCVQTDRRCEGYRSDQIAHVREGLTQQSLPSVRTTQILFNSPDSISSNATLDDSLVARLARLGVSILRLESYGAQCTSASVSWISLLNKACNLSRTVYAASSALGAAYEALRGSRAGHKGNPAAAPGLYHMALALLQKDLLSPGYNPLALLLASLILSGFEVLHKNLTNALMHVQNAFKMYEDFVTGTLYNEISPTRLTIEDAELLALDFVIRNIDLQNMTYKLSNSSRLPQLHGTLKDQSHARVPSRSMGVDSDLLSLLQACYSFSLKVTPHKYTMSSQIPIEEVETRDNYLARLKLWLSESKAQHQRLLPKPGHISAPQIPPTSSSILSLQLQCLSAVVYLSSILSPYEATFDTICHIFQQIVDTATQILSSRSASSDQPEVYFRMTSVLAQPLFLTAMKCRDADLRRDSIRLLARTGWEGPWDAHILVAVANRAMLLEEQWSENAAGEERLDWQGHQGEFANLRRNNKMNKKTVPESARLHVCGMGHISTDSGAPVDGIIPPHSHGKYHRTIEFRFRRCRNIEKMLQAHTENSNSSDDDPEHWEVWDEKIEL